jgi:hypothetical protein
LRSRTRFIALLATTLAAGAALAGTAGAAQSAQTAAGENVVLTGPTRLIAGGDTIILDGQGRGHRLRGQAGILAQLRQLVGKRITVEGTAVSDPARQPHYPILVRDFRLEQGGAVNGQLVTITGPTRRLADGDVIVSDTLNRGHRLRASSAALRAEILRLAGKRVTVEGTALVTNAAGRTHWPINVTHIVAAP